MSAKHDPPKSKKSLFRLSEEMKRKLKEQAFSEERSMNDVVSDAIEAYINANTR